MAKRPPPNPVAAQASPKTQQEAATIEEQIEALNLDAFDYVGEDDDGAPTASGSAALGDNQAEFDGIIAYEGVDHRVQGRTVDTYDFSTPKPDWSRLIFMRMGKPDHLGAGKLYGWGEGGTKRMMFKPFGISPPLHPKFVASVMKIPAAAGTRPHGYYWQHFWPAPAKLSVDTKGKEIPESPRGDCQNKLSFLDKISGQRINTCIYGDCPRHPQPKGLHHSIHQAQLFIGRLKSDSVIRRYVKNFDPRQEVAHFAQLVMTHRAARLKDQMGLGAEPDNLTF